MGTCDGVGIETDGLGIWRGSPFGAVGDSVGLQSPQLLIASLRFGVPPTIELPGPELNGFGVFVWAYTGRWTRLPSAVCLPFFLSVSARQSAFESHSR